MKTSAATCCAAAGVPKLQAKTYSSYGATTRRGKSHLILCVGVIPYWCKDPAGGRKPINAKCETVRTLPTFRDAYRLADQGIGRAASFFGKRLARQDEAACACAHQLHEADRLELATTALRIEQSAHRLSEVGTPSSGSLWL
jgi:hypothetical protein